MPTIPNAALTKWRIEKTRNEAEYIELKTSILRGDHLDRQKLQLALREICLAIKEIVMGSRQLSTEEKLELLEKLATIPLRHSRNHAAPAGDRESQSSEPMERRC